MEPCWINVCEQEPEEGREVQVLVVQGTDRNGYDIGYGKATLTESGWRFSNTPQYPRVVAWLESDRFLSGNELSQVSKDRIRF